MLATSKTLLKLVYDSAPSQSTQSLPLGTLTSQSSPEVSIKKDIMDNFISTFNHEERNLVSIAYRNITQSLRKAFRNIMMNANSKKNSSNDLVKSKIFNEYKVYLAHLLISTCNDCLDTLKFLAKREMNPEAYTFYKKMEGDYNRYLAEVLIAVKSNKYLGDGDDNEEDDDVMKVIGNLDVKKIIATAGMYVYTLFERCVVMTFLFSIRVKL